MTLIEALALSANCTTASAQQNELLEKQLAATMMRIVNAIKAKNYDCVNDCFNADGLEMYKKLLHYGQARILGKTQEESSEISVKRSETSPTDDNMKSET